MKTRIQMTPALTVALLCAAVWFAFWLLAFRPAPVSPPLAATCPQTIRLKAGSETVRELLMPDRFALPAATGFSGPFPGKQGISDMELRRPENPPVFLTRERVPPPPTLLQKITAAPAAGTDPLISKTGSSGKPVALPPGIFLSPELQPRNNGKTFLPLPGQGQSETLTARITINPAGEIRDLFLETASTNTALQSLLRKLRFSPASGETSGQIEIRLPAEARP